MNWSTQGEQRVVEIASQTNTRLEPLAKSNFFIQWFLLDVVSPVESTPSENSIFYYPSYVYSATDAGKVSSRRGF